MKNTLFALLLILSICCKAQERVLQYFPEGRDIICINGNNRYTRALYGSHSPFRLETSDRPVFAIFDGKKGRNIQLYLEYKDSTLALDSTSWCKAFYQGGIRRYELKDNSWGKGVLYISAMASFSSDSAVFHIKCEGFDQTPNVCARVAPMAKTKMSRNGDLGVDPRENFEASDSDRVFVNTDLLKEAVLVVGQNSQSLLQGNEGKNLFLKEKAKQEELANTIEINTPNPFLNTIGANLVAAADGLWDGTTHTWLHGCIGWRTPLAGWRAGYVGDVIGWNDRAIEHFNAYANSMVTDVPQTISHPTQDPKQNLARAERKWGTPMYSNGYICKSPNRKDVMNHYDMNLNYVDELLWHFCYDADTIYMSKMWPILTAHLDWEKRNYDPDGDHLYDAYCCIWASDALYYNSGAVTHSSAYNYRGNLLTARIAEIIGEDPTPYRKEAEDILAALNSRLWMKDKGVWAEFQDFMGLKRLHTSPALWTIYTPIDCGACTPEQAYLAASYVDQHFSHIPVKISDSGFDLSLHNLATIPTTNWFPYVWSTNNVAHEEVANMALAFFKAGLGDAGYKLLLSDIIDEMYLGLCPGNFGQISYYDKARSEAYRDFGDNVGITSRAIVNGLFGIIPDALNGKCIIRPSFPEDWNEASIRTPYLSYKFKRENGEQVVYDIEQNFPQPLEIVVEKHQTANFVLPNYIEPSKNLSQYGLDDITPNAEKKQHLLDISQYYNSNVDDIFKNEYLSPRSPYTTLQIPIQGVGEWCIPKEYHEIEDNGLRNVIKNGVFDTNIGVKFSSPKEGKNIAYTSLWDNYPNELEIIKNLGVTMNKRFKYAYFLLAGSTNNMQSRIDNAVILANYIDGTADTLKLENPTNWCPIEQDYYYDEYAFKSEDVHPYRVSFSDGKVSRKLDSELQKSASNGEGANFTGADNRIIPSGAGVLLKMPLNRSKRVDHFTLRTLSNDVVVGVMSITLEE